MFPFRRRDLLQEAYWMLLKGCFVKQYSYKTNSETFDSYDNENVNNNDGQKQNEANDEVSMSLSDLWVLQATR